MWCAFAELLAKYCEIPEHKHMINLLYRLESTLSTNANFFDSVEELDGMTVEKGFEDGINSATSHKILKLMAKLFKSCCNIFRKNMNYLHAKASLSHVLTWIQRKYEEIFTKDLALQNKKDAYIEKLLACLMELQNFVELEDMTAHYSQNIVRILFNWNLLQNTSRDTEDQLHWEYGLISK